MYQEQHCKIWTLSDGRSEYERYSYLLEKPDGEGLSATNLNGQLLSRAAPVLRGRHSTAIVHDQSDIRKEHSSQMEDLDLVKALDGSLVPGYRTFNSIAIADKNIHLLSCTPYSSQEGDYDKTLSPEGSFSAMQWAPCNGMTGFIIFGYGLESLKSSKNLILRNMVSLSSIYGKSLLS